MVYALLGVLTNLTFLKNGVCLYINGDILTSFFELLTIINECITPSLYNSEINFNDFLVYRKVMCL